MVDATTLIVISTLVQTAVITLTLLVFIFQFRSQERAIREASYQNVMGRYNDYVMSGSTSDDLLLARLFAPENKLSPEELGSIRRMMIAYGILEEAYELYLRGWIDKETWDQWDAWLKVLCKYPYFATVHVSTSGMYNKKFQDHVSELLKPNSTSATEKKQ